MLVMVSDQSYYEAIVQVIPILLLTMAVGEARLRVRDTLSIRTAILGVLLLALYSSPGRLLHSMH